MGGLVTTHASQSAAAPLVLAIPAHLGPESARRTLVNAILIVPSPPTCFISSCLPAFAPSVAPSPSLSLILERALCQEDVEGGGGVDSCQLLAIP